MSSHLNVTGTWTCIYNYPHSYPAQNFQAELREFEGSVTGETTELGQYDDDLGQIVHALLEGTRIGNAVSFVKRYDSGEASDHVVDYAGLLDSEGQEISGSWTIAGEWSGTFIMVRRSAGIAHVEQLAAEKV